MLDKMGKLIADVEETTVTVRKVMVEFTFTDEDLQDDETKALYDVLVASKGAVVQEEVQTEDDEESTVQAY